MRKMRHRVVVRIGAVAFVMAICVMLLLHRPEEIENLKKISIIERSIRMPMNQIECHHPHLPIDNPEIMQFYAPVAKLNCGNDLDDWVMCEKSICFVKPEVTSNQGEVMCSYTDLIRKSDYKVIYGKTTRTKDPYILHQTDFVKVVCKAESGFSWSGIVYGIRDGAVPAKSLRTADVDAEPPNYYNVLMFGFDSLSRNAFMRTLPKTYKYLTQTLNAVVLKGYNIVGDGTPQALVPILTGYTELELPETRTRMSASQSVDIYPMIWKDYAAQGYFTSFNEDLPKVGTFTYRMNGFNAQPVDHYLRTFYLEALNQKHKEHCIDHKSNLFVMLDYTKNFMVKYKESPRFVFSFHGSLSHDSINLIAAADDEVMEWLSTLLNEHLLQNTILIFMSDHGNRFSNVRATLQGKQEERLPFFSFAFPESFQKAYPTQYKNFINNVDRLTTPFDVHATLKDILNLQNLQQKDNDHKESLNIQISKLASGRAISLFDKIPSERSCADAYIEPHWCACLQWQQIQLNDTERSGVLLKAASSIVDAINNATNPYRNICAPLELHKTNWAMRLLPHKEMLTFKGNSDTDGFLADMSDKMRLGEEIYQLQIVVNPGQSLFEASVTYSLQTFAAITRLSEISRINKYGSQANCIYERNPELRKYCYCRT